MIAKFDGGLFDGRVTMVARLAQNGRIGDLSMITNGVALAQEADKLFKAGLQRITVSLDTLWPERFRELTGKTLDRAARELEQLR